MKTQNNRSWQRLALFITGVVVAIFGVVGTGAGSVSAHHADVTASVTCERVVTWHSEAWNPGDGDASARTNPDVRIYYERSSDRVIVPLLNGAFNAGNGYSLSGQFVYPDGQDVIYVWAESVGTWGNGGGGGDKRYAEVHNPKPCPTTTIPATTTTEPVVTTTTEPVVTTTTEPVVTTTTEPVVTTTTEPVVTTTTEVDSGGPTTTTTVVGTTTTLVGTTTTVVGSGGPTTTTTVVGSGGPTTTVAGSLPRTGGSSGSLGLISLGLLLIGASFMLTTRRPAV